MTAQEYAQAGRLAEAVAALQQEIRNKPEDTKLRVFLFQLNSVLGRLEKAQTQLEVLASLDVDSRMFAQVFGPVVTCEMLRREIFAGNRTPLIFGEPENWMGALVQANAMIGKGQYAAAAKVRSDAFEAAPAVAGALNGTAFEWIADADSRLGPLMEVILEGKYYWVPFSRIRKVVVEAPHDLRDLVWIAAQFEWSNGGTASGHIPVRYPGTEDSPDGALQLARRTDWQEREGETFLGLGQRLFATDAGEYPLLECRTLELRTTA